MKMIKFQTTFHKELKGCKNPKNIHLLANVELPAPENIEEMDGYELTQYVEINTGLFVLEGFEIIEQ